MAGADAGFWFIMVGGFVAVLMAVDAWMLQHRPRLAWLYAGAAGVLFALSLPALLASTLP